MADWRKIWNLKKNNLPLRQLDDFSEEEKRTIVEKNTVKKIRPKHLCKKYHTFQYVIESFIKSAPQISQKQERIQQEQEETKLKVSKSRKQKPLEVVDSKK